jgi:hypothetical protein
VFGWGELGFGNGSWGGVGVKSPCMVGGIGSSARMGQGNWGAQLPRISSLGVGGNWDEMGSLHFFSLLCVSCASVHLPWWKERKTPRKSLLIRGKII